MPHAELSYSADLTLDAAALLQQVEATILSFDAGAGICKGRAYPAPIFHHSHALLSVSLLSKPHRDAAFSAALIDALEKDLKAALREPAYLSVDLRYSTPFYRTHEGMAQPEDAG